jgi:integrase
MTRRAPFEHSIYPRLDGVWVAAVHLGYENGKRKRKWFYGRTRREAMDKMNAALRQQEHGLDLARPDQPLDAYLKAWLDEAARPSVRPRTLESYELNVRRITKYLGRVKLSELKPTDVQSLYAKLLADGLSRRTVEQCHTVVHNALGQAVKWGLLGRNPSDAVTVPRPAQQEMNVLSTGELRHLFDTSRDDRWHALWVVMGTTGLRLGEATGLTWDDLDLDQGRAVVQRALQRQRGAGLVLVEPKTRLSRRTVHLSGVAGAALREHRVRQVEQRLAAGPAWRDTGLVFTTITGDPVDPSRVNEFWHRALGKAGLRQVRVHDLRHSAATMMLERGIHPRVVQEMLGHSTITLTLGTYSHVAPAMHAEAAREMDAVFGASDTVAGAKVRKQLRDIAGATNIPVMPRPGRTMITLTAVSQRCESVDVGDSFPHQGSEQSASGGRSRVGRPQRGDSMSEDYDVGRVSELLELGFTVDRILLALQRDEPRPDERELMKRLADELRGQATDPLGAELHSGLVMLGVPSGLSASTGLSGPVDLDAVRRFAEFLSETLTSVSRGHTPDADVERLRAALQALSEYTLHEASAYSAAPVPIEA